METIYDFGFDANLNKKIEQGVGSLVYDMIDSVESGGVDYSGSPVLVKNVQLRVYRETDQGTDAGTIKVLLNKASYDIGNDFDLVNSKFVAKYPARYLISAAVVLKADAAQYITPPYGLKIYKNGVEFSSQMLDLAVITSSDQIIIDNNKQSVFILTDTIQLVKDDFLELYTQFSDTGPATHKIVGGEGKTYMTIFKL